MDKRLTIKSLNQLNRNQPKIPHYSTVENLLLDDIWKKEFFIVFSFIINITTSKLTKTSHYSKRQQKLYDKIKDLKEVKRLSYRKISEKLKTLRYRSVQSGKVLKPNYIFSIYKKGKIREERINRSFKDRISDMDFGLVKNM